jgi:hypothetical protein
MFGYLLIVGIASAMETSAMQKADQAFGHAQVEQVIYDRPDMGPIINREPALRALLESSFAGKFVGQRVYWDGRNPSTGSRSEQIPNYQEYPNLVRVTNRPDVSAIDKCTLLVLELQNARSSNRLAAICSLVRTTQMNRNDFARSCVQLEYLGVQRTKEFFREHPLAKTNSKVHSDYNWIMIAPAEFSDYLNQTGEEGKKKNQLLEYYRRDYDRMLSESMSNDLYNVEVKVNSHDSK